MRCNLCICLSGVKQSFVQKSICKGGCGGKEKASAAVTCARDTSQSLALLDAAAPRVGVAIRSADRRGSCKTCRNAELRLCGAQMHAVERPSEWDKPNRALAGPVFY
jgi:hypothetical protein